MAMSQPESVARAERGKKEGLKFSLGDKLERFLADTTKAAESEIEKTHADLVTDPGLSETEQNSLRDVAQMATQQLEAVTGFEDLAGRLQQIQEAEAAGDGERISLLQSQIAALWMQLEGGSGEQSKSKEPVAVVEAPPSESVAEVAVAAPSLPEPEAPVEPVAEKEVVAGLELPKVPPLDQGKLEVVQGYQEQAEKEILLLQEKIPSLKGRAYAQAVQRLEDLTKYEQELVAQETDLKDPMVIERVGDDRAPDVAAGRQASVTELELSAEEASRAKELRIDWGAHLTEETRQLEQTRQMIEAAEETMADFKESHADSPGLTPTEQQYLWTLESDIAWYQAREAFMKNSLEGLMAQKWLQDFATRFNDSGSDEEAKAMLAKARQNKAALELALIAATQKMQEARSSYTRLLAEAGVQVEPSAEQEDAHEEIERAEEWSFGRSFDPDEGYHGRGIGAEQTGPKEKEIFTLNGGGHAEKEEEGFFSQTWKGLSGWLKSLFG